MNRRHRREEDDNPDRWVVSYADFITLLFAFFATLYAISRVDLGKLEMFTGSMKSAFRVKQSGPPVAGVLDGIRPAPYADIRLENDLREELGKSGIMEGIAVTHDDRGVVVSLGDTLLFESGSAEVKKAARPVLALVAEFINKTGRSIVIEGHTDNIPLRSAKYASNVELSAARAAGAFSVLLNEDAVSPDRLSTAGYGEYRPVASNATFEGRARNRRIDIIFVAGKEAP